MKTFQDFLNEKKTPKYQKRGKCVFSHENPKVKDKKDHFPINDSNQARNALGRAGQYSSVPPWFDGSLEELKDSIRRKVKSEYPSIEVTESVTNEGNMSYCRFENTYHDLQDCYHHMDDELSKDENDFKTMLIDLCEDIAKEYGDCEC